MLYNKKTGCGVLLFYPLDNCELERSEAVWKKLGVQCQCPSNHTFSNVGIGLRKQNIKMWK